MIKKHARALHVNAHDRGAVASASRLSEQTGVNLKSYKDLQRDF